MFKPVTFYSAICDRCGAHFEEEYDCIHRHYFSEKEVLSFGTNDNLSGSWEIIGEKSIVQTVTKESWLTES